MSDFLYGGFIPEIKFNNPAKPTYKECLSCFTEYLKSVPFFSSNDWNNLEDYWEYFHLSKNNPIVLPGEICEHIVFICRGAVKHYTENISGKYIITFATEGYFCTAIPSFLNQAKAKDGLICVKSTFGLKISLPNYKKLSAEHPAFEQLFQKISEEELLRLVNRLTSFQSTDAKGRYDLLMQQNSSVFNHFTMLDISNYLGIKPETLSRLRSEKRNL